MFQAKTKWLKASVLDKTQDDEDTIRLVDLGLLGQDDLERLGLLVESFLQKVGFTEVDRIRKKELVSGVSGMAGPSGPSGMSGPSGPHIGGGAGGAGALVHGPSSTPVLMGAGGGGGVGTYTPGHRTPFPSSTSGSAFFGEQIVETITAKYTVTDKELGPLGELPISIRLLETEAHVRVGSSGQDIPDSVGKRDNYWDGFPGKSATTPINTLDGMYARVKEDIVDLINNGCDWCTGGKARYEAEHKKAHKRTIFDVFRHHPSNRDRA